MLNIDDINDFGITDERVEYLKSTGSQAQNTSCMRQLVYIESCMGKSPII